MNYSIKKILEEIFGTPQKEDNESGQLRFDCPICSQKKMLPHGKTDGKGNLEVNISESYEGYLGVYKCWVCSETDGTHGSLNKLIKTFGNHSQYNRFLLELTQEEKNLIIGKSINNNLNIVEKNLGLEEIKLFEKFKNFKFDNNEEEIKPFNYLKERNITKYHIEKYNIKYQDKYEKIDNLRSFHGRIIFPSKNIDGKIDYFVARDYLNRDKKYKYQNPEFDKNEIIFNEFYLNYDADIYLVEGVTDHIVTPNSVPLLGKTISDKLFYNLQKKASGNIIIFLDEDAFQNTINLYEKLNSSKLKNRIRLIKISNYNNIELDPSKINEIWGKRGIMSYMKKQRKLTLFDKNSFLSKKY